MRRRIIIWSAIIVLFSSGTLLCGQNVEIQNYYDAGIGETVPAAVNEVVVKFSRDLADEEIAKINQKYEVQIIEKIELFKIYRVRVPEGKTVEEIVEEYRREPGVVYAEPNFVHKSFAIIPNDPESEKQWAIEKIELDRAWEVEKGNPEVIVAILDSGIDLDHPDLKDNIITGYDFVDEDSLPGDNQGHGTLCAGIIGARGDNGIGIAGVTWNCKLMPIRVTDAEGTYFNLAQGIIYAAENGAKVLNISLGGCAYSMVLEEAVNYALLQGCALVAGVGDDNTDKPVYPAGYEGVIGVAATNSEDKVSSDSNYGDFIDLFAPGVGIYSTFLNGGYAYSSGSSAATPLVSGLAALIISADPSLNGERVKEILYTTADYIKPDYKAKYGRGRINAYRALTMAKGIEVIDIAIVDMEVIPKAPISGQEAEVKVTLQNRGSIETTETNLRLYVDELLLETVLTVPPLLPNETTTRKFKWVP